MKKLLLLLALVLVNACGPQTSIPIAESATLTVSPVSEVPTTSPKIESQTDLFTVNLITLPSPVCDGTLTPEQTEGPYYTPDTPERKILLEDGMSGERLVIAGYVLDENCRPIPNAWLDFWQADANGVYDNQGYILRGHQFTDSQGRYILETIIPGEYPGRTQHIHVKVQRPDGEVITSQLYFPDSAENATDGIFNPGLLVTLEDRGDYSVAYYNFVVK